METNITLENKSNMTDESLSSEYFYARQKAWKRKHSLGILKVVSIQKGRIPQGPADEAHRKT